MASKMSMTSVLCYGYDYSKTYNLKTVSLTPLKGLIKFLQFCSFKINLISNLI